MKKLVFILFVFVSVGAFGQVKKVTINSKKMVLIDGQVFDKGAFTIPKDSILTINSLEKEDIARTFPNAKNGMVIIVTKNGATRSYREKLSAFSKDYAEHIKEFTKYNVDDGVLLYTINDKPLLKKDKITQELYNLPAKNIKEVKLKRQVTCCGTNIRVTIITQ